MVDWERKIKQFVGYLQHERRVSLSSQSQYRSIVKDWIGFSLGRSHDPATFDQALVDTLLDHRAHRNSKGVLAVGSRLSYTSNLKVFCEWASAGRPAAPKFVYSQSPPSQPNRRDRPPRSKKPKLADSQPPLGQLEDRSRHTGDVRDPKLADSQPPALQQIWIELWQGPLPSPINALERLLRQGGTTIVRAAFKYSFFAHPDAVRRKTPWYPERARTSRKHYPGRDRGDTALWRARSVTLGDNSYAQHAWTKYTGRPIERGSGFSVRHIWGNPWDPEAFTAGWNLCYMPFWAGMLTEKQHQHPELKAAVRQAAWNLYFGADPVCEPPEYVNAPDVDLGQLLGKQPIRVLQPSAP